MSYKSKHLIKGQNTAAVHQKIVSANIFRVSVDKKSATNVEEIITELEIQRLNKYKYSQNLLDKYKWQLRIRSDK